jgi:hypothetical protein
MQDMTGSHSVETGPAQVTPGDLEPGGDDDAAAALRIVGARQPADTGR